MRKTSVLIVGSGFAGLCMAIRLKQSSQNDFLILEQSSAVGGTWRDNTYPGAECDVESDLYSFSFAPNPNWSKTFSKQNEILKYIHYLVDHYKLTDHILLNSKVNSAEFNQLDSTWKVQTENGQVYACDNFIPACGGLSRPALPDISGIEKFQGKMFHSARWDHSFSLKGKRVAVIGTGASAIQIIPAIADSVAELIVFQRTAPWVMPKVDPVISDQQKNRFRKFPFLQKIRRAMQYLRHEIMVLGFITPIRILNVGEWLGRRYIRKQIADPALRPLLTPNFKMGCKRVLLSNDYYPAMQKNNVKLIVDPIQEIVSNGIRTKTGDVHEVDLIVVATGFQAAESVAPFRIVGRDQMSLQQVWKENAEGYLGTTIHGFPNLFMIVGPNTGLGHSSMLLMIESQVNYILGALNIRKTKSLKTIEVKSDVQKNFNQMLQEKFPATIWASGCNSWYQTSKGRNTTLWPGTTFGFRKRTAQFDFENYNLN